MKKFLYFSCLVFILSACFIGVKAGILKQATNQNYAEYVHKYNKIKKVAEQYENNIVLSHSDSYFFGYLGDFGEGASEEEIKKSKEPLGKYDVESCVKFLGVDYNSLNDKMSSYVNEEANVTFSDLESTATSFYDYNFSYYYDTENDVLIQYVETGYRIDDDAWHDNQEYYIWNNEGMVTYERN